jgi:ATP-binding cassette, subfamily B, bacterial MsbA
MKGFSRTVRLALRHQWTLGLSLGCALLVAVLWGGNITVIYPFVEVLFQGKSMPVWIDEEIAKQTKAIADFDKQLAELNAKLAQATPDEALVLQKSVEQIEGRRKAEQTLLGRYKMIQPWIHRWMPRDAFQTLIVMLLALLLGTIVKEFFLIVNSILVARISELATFDLRQEFYSRMLQMDLASFSQNTQGDLTNRFTTDIGSVSQGLQTLFGRAIREPLKMIACLIGAGMVCWRLLVVSLLIAPLAGWLVNRLSKSLKRANRRAMEGMSEIYNTLSETFAGIKVVKAFTMERYELRRFQKTARAYFKKTMKIAAYNSLISPLNEIMGIIMISFALLAGAYLALNQQTHLFGIKMSDRPLDLGALILFYGLLAGVSDPARKLSDVFGRLQQASAACERIYEVIDRQPKIVDPPHPLDMPRHKLDLVIERVTFGYDPLYPVLENVSLRIAAGETVAIVGPNGCGKSTLANLIPRFFDPDQGTVRVDGVDVRDVRRRDLRKQIGVVTQETVLFDDTVYNNIRYGAPRARREDVIAAAKQAHAHKFIEDRLNDGYETRVGFGGGGLSGGQRQRISLARAILRDPSILILDEATSQVDLESEQLLHQVLEKFTRDRTTIIITHRLSTLALADRIVVMNTGRITDVGTHEELLARCEFYRRLHQIELRQSA